MQIRAHNKSRLLPALVVMNYCFPWYFGVRAREHYYENTLCLEPSPSMTSIRGIRLLQYSFHIYVQPTQNQILYGDCSS